MFEDFWRAANCAPSLRSRQGCGRGAECAARRTSCASRDAALHFWEEPPISGEAAAEPCSSRIVLCIASIAKTPALPTVVQERTSPSRAWRGIFLELQGKGALNINLVTATHYAPMFSRRFGKRAQGFVCRCLEHLGYEAVETVRLVAPYVQTFLTDFRYTDPETARAYSHAPDYPHIARAALDEMVRGDADVIVRILALPGHIDEAKGAVRYLYETYGDRVVLSMMSQYTPAGSHPEHPELDRRVSPEEFEELLDFADAIGCDEYFWQEGDAAQESFIPDFYSLEGVLGPE
ncbi:MAG: radical SAM protein [Eggerthellaceae bacterium]